MYMHVKQGATAVESEHINAIYLYCFFLNKSCCCHPQATGSHKDAIKWSILRHASML